MAAKHRSFEEPNKGPQVIKDVLAELILRRGYAREQSSAALEDAWRTAAGDFMAGHTRCGNLRRGVLEVFVTNSLLIQEMTYRKPALLQELVRLLPDARIKDIKFRVAPVH